jgi:AP-4 complex subunit epsilon-1
VALSKVFVFSQTVKLLNQIDQNIVASYYTQSLDHIPADLSPAHRAEYAYRLLEVLEIDSDGDGERYAREAEQLFERIYAINTEEKEVVLESAVEKVLIRVRQGIHLTQYFGIEQLIVLF